MSAYRKLKVYAYGFERIGFHILRVSDTSGAFEIEFLNYDSEMSLDDANGVIIPSGIFKTAASNSGTSCDLDMLVRREKQLLNAMKRGCWVVFLLRELKSGKFARAMGDDLAQKVLARFARPIIRMEPEPDLRSNMDEFRDYFQQFGIARTYFNVISTGPSHKILAYAIRSDGVQCPVGLEVERRFFFLPFSIASTDANAAMATARCVAEAVMAYKAKREIQLPAWVGQLAFDEELQLKSDLRNAKGIIAGLEMEIDKWARYKAILTTNSELLVKVVLEILTGFFRLSVKSVENFVEDALILDDSGSPSFVLEIKGVKGRLKREYVDQLNSHRERLQLESTPGLLIINDSMEVAGLEERKRLGFDVMHLKRAQEDNVRILRTVTLFEIVQKLGAEADKKAAFFAMCDGREVLISAPAA